MNNYIVKDQKLWQRVPQDDGSDKWEDVLRVPNSEKEETKKAVRDLQDWQHDQKEELPDGVVKGIAEIEKFLEGTSDSRKLTELFSSLQTAIANALGAKQDIISDLSTIRSNAQAGKDSSDLVGDTVLVGIRAEENGSLIARYRTNKEDDEQ